MLPHTEGAPSDFDSGLASDWSLGRSDGSQLDQRSGAVVQLVRAVVVRYVEPVLKLLAHVVLVETHEVSFACIQALGSDERLLRSWPHGLHHEAQDHYRDEVLKAEFHCLPRGRLHSPLRLKKILHLIL